jgi:preprotein translocase subunit SecE
MNKVFNMFSESYQEITERVSWPTWTQLTQSTAVVIGATLFITAIIGLMDLAVSFLLKFIY